MRHPSTGVRPARGLAWLGLLLAGCVSTEHQSRDWSTYEGPGAEYFQAEEIEFPNTPDPLEPVNRGSAMLNYGLLRWVIAPTARVYRFVLPRPVRSHLASAADNLRYPTRVLANLLQGKWHESTVETWRFAVNSTVGLAGLFDPAQRFGLHPYPEDFGQTFATWGWQKSPYLFLPFLGPSTIRDGLGEIPDALTYPPTYYSPSVYVLGYNSYSEHVDADLRAIHSTYDAYEPGRTVFSLQRLVDVEDFEWKEDQSGPTQTLSSIFLVPEDPDFGAEARTMRVAIPGSDQELPFSLWMQPKPAPILYVVPGMGGNRLSPSALALAEIGFARGHSVVAISNPTNFEFMVHGSSVPVPGFGPQDAHDLHVAMTAIDGMLADRYPGRLRERRIVGLSLGAYQALTIMAGGDASTETGHAEGLLTFERCLAMNPPVDFEHALKQLDRFYNAPLALPPEERTERIDQIYSKVLYLSHGDLEPGEELPFTEMESQFLIGLAFRMDLQFMILQSADLDDTGMLLTPRSRWHKAPAFQEAAEYSFMEYVYAFLLPYYAQHAAGIGFDEAGARTLMERSALTSMTAGLRANPAVRVFTNANDFLLRPGDLEWLRSTLGERLTVFPDGGHLGNLYREYIRAEIGSTIAEEATE